MISDHFCRMLYRRLDLFEAIEASRLEEEFQLEIWGVVEGGHDMDRLNNAARLSSVGTFMHLYKDHLDMQHLWRHLSADEGVL